MSCGYGPNYGCGNKNVMAILVLLLLCSGHEWGNYIC